MGDNIYNQDPISVKRKGINSEIQFANNGGDDLESHPNVYVTFDGGVNATYFTGDGGHLSNITSGGGGSGNVGPGTINTLAYFDTTTSVVSADHISINNTLNTLEVSGNVFANQFIGDGGLLSNIDANVGPGTVDRLAYFNTSNTITSADFITVNTTSNEFLIDGDLTVSGNIHSVDHLTTNDAVIVLASNNTSDLIASGIMLNRPGANVFYGVTGGSKNNFSIGLTNDDDTISSITMLDSNDFQASIYGSAAIKGNNQLLFTDNVLINTETSTSGRIAVGYLSGSQGQNNNSVAIGVYSGSSSQGRHSFALGAYSGYQNQGDYSVSIGQNSAFDTQGNFSIAIGDNAAVNYQGDNAVAVGSNAGNQHQGDGAIAIGQGSSINYQGERSISIGSLSNATQSNSISIGYLSKTENENTIVLNASGTNLTSSNSDATYINPIRNVTVNSNVLSYDRTSKEIVDTGLISISGSNVVISNLDTDLNLQQVTDNGRITTNTVEFQNSQTAFTITETNSTIYFESNVRIASNDHRISIGKETSTSGGERSIYIGQRAGQNSSGNDTIGIGYYAGRTLQGINSIAIGNQAGTDNQQQYAIAIGDSAGSLKQNNNSIAIGTSAGSSGQFQSTIAIGTNSGTNQREYSIAIGNQAGNDTQSQRTVAIGENAGRVTQGVKAIAIGSNAGYYDQDDQGVAIGTGAGEYYQKPHSIAIGQSAGSNVQGINSISIGQNAGREQQDFKSIAIGLRASEYNQGSESVSIGADSNASATNTISIGNNSTAHGQYATTVGSGAAASGSYSSAFGTNSSASNFNAIAVGRDTTATGSGATALGHNATASGSSATALGHSSFVTGNYSSAIGYAAQASGNRSFATGLGAQATNDNTFAAGQSANASGGGAIAIGHNSKALNTSAVALGNSSNAAGFVSVAIGSTIKASGISSVAMGNSTNAEGEASISIGSSANTTGNYSMAMGPNAKANAQNAIAIGSQSNANTSDTIVLNASGTNLTSSNSSSFYVNPIRHVEVNSNVLSYDRTSKEIVDTGLISISGSNVVISNLDTDLNLQQVTDNGRITTNTVEFQNTENALIVTETNSNIYFESNVRIASNGHSVAIGNNAGLTSQGSYTVAIGVGAGQGIQGNQSIAIGYGAGTLLQGTNSVAIGALAGNLQQSDNTIALNATGDVLPANTFTNALYIKPIRPDVNSNILQYNDTTGEVTSNNTINISGDITANAFFGTITETSNLEQVVNRGNVTTQTVEFKNPETALIATGNIVANMVLNETSNLVYYDTTSNVLTYGPVPVQATSNLQQVSDVGNTTTNTIEFKNPETALIATGNIVANMVYNPTANLVYYDTTSNVLTHGPVPVQATSNLQQVTDVGNTTTNTIEFNNPETALIATGNIVANMVYNPTANLVYYDTTSNVLTHGPVPVQATSNLQQVTDVGNTTTNTVEFKNPETALIATGNIVANMVLNETSNLVYYDTTSNVLTYGPVPVQATSNLQQVTNVGNTTTNTVEFQNSQTAFTTDLVSNVGVKLDQLSNVVIDTPVDEQLLIYDGTDWVNTFNQHAYIRVRNETGSTIEKGKCVYIIDANNNNIANVALARADSQLTMPCIGIILENIATGNNGFAVTYGKAIGVNTFDFQEGEKVYVSNVTAGAVSNVAPYGTSFPDLIQNVGIVMKSGTNGTIFVTGVGRANDIPNAEILPNETSVNYVYVNTSNNDLKKIDPQFLTTNVHTLQQVTTAGNTTTNTVEFQNSQTAFIITETNSSIDFSSNIIINSGGNQIAIGADAGQIQGDNAIAIGTQAGNNTQNNSAIAIGVEAGNDGQGLSAISIGENAGNASQGDSAIAIGTQAGNANQNNSAVSIGYWAGKTGQKNDAVALGRQAGEISQGRGSIAIGLLAGKNNQGNNTIALNATETLLAANAFTNALYIKPIRSNINSNILQYNETTGEVTSNNTINISGDITANAFFGTVTETSNLEQVVNRGNTTSNTVYFQNGTLSFKADSNIEVGTANLFVDTTTGRVGIGTTSPAQKLHVGNGTDTINLQVQNPSGNVYIGQSGSTRFGYSAGTAHIHQATSLPYAIGTQTGDDLTLGTDNNARITIKQAGDVGIGTTNPSVKLTVQEDSSSLIPMLSLKNDNTTNNNGTLLEFSGSNGTYGTINCKYVNHSSDLSSMSFSTKDRSGSGLVEQLIITETREIKLGKAVQMGSLTTKGTTLTAGVPTTVLKFTQVSGQGLFMVSVVQYAGSYNNHWVGIIGADAPSVSLSIYTVIQSNNFTASISGMDFQITSPINTRADANAIPLVLGR